MTALSRRSVLGASAVGVAMTLFSAPEAFAGAAKARHYTRSRFVRLRRKSFRLTSPTGSWSVKLTGVADLTHSRHGDERSFSLTFRTKTAGPPQGTYLLRRAGFGSTALFLVPSDASHRTYQAIIN